MLTTVVTVAMVTNVVEAPRKRLVPRRTFLRLAYAIASRYAYFSRKIALLRRCADVSLNPPRRALPLFIQRDDFALTKRVVYFRPALRALSSEAASAMMGRLVAFAGSCVESGQTTGRGSGRVIKAACACLV